MHSNTEAMPGLDDIHDMLWVMKSTLRQCDAKQTSDVYIFCGGSITANVVEPLLIQQYPHMH
jgi:triosephosphate isomerase